MDGQRLAPSPIEAAAPSARTKPIAAGMNPLSPLPWVMGGSRTTEDRPPCPAEPGG